MRATIAVAGKGGTGKTIIAAWLVKLLSQKGVVLAVDADPSTNLNQALGLPLEETVGGVREKLSDDVSKGRIPPETPKQDIVDYRIMASLVESKGLDLLAMGRPEGPTCYCAANNMLRASLARLAKNYDYVVMDCEAGMEHISRRTTDDVDILLVVSDPTVRGITTAARIRDLAKELDTRVRRIYLVVNRVRDGLPVAIKKAIDESGLEVLATIPEDPSITELETKGIQIIELPPDSPFPMKVKEILEACSL